MIQTLYYCKILNFYWWRTLKVSPAQVYSLLYRSIDLSTDPGLKSHLITFPCPKRAAASTRIFILLYHNKNTNEVMIKR
jgi:hypothetical protein